MWWLFKKKVITKALKGTQFTFLPTPATLSNQYHADMANRYFDEARNSAGSGAWSAIKGGYHWLMSKPMLFGETDTKIGLPPANIGGIGKAANVVKAGAKAVTKTTSKASKIAALTVKEDKAAGVSRKVKDSVKHGKGYDSGDARAVNSGQSRVQNNLIRLALELMADPKYNASYSRELNRLLVKLAKATTPEVVARIKTELRDLAKRFISEGWLH